MKLSVRTKLFGAFGVVLALMVAVIGVALVSMSGLSAQNGNITQTSSPKVVAGLTLRFDGANLKGWQTAEVLDHGKSAGAFDRSRATFQAELAKVKNLSTDQQDKQDTTRIEAAYQRYVALHARIRAALQAGNSTGAEKIALGASVAAFHSLDNELNLFVKHARTMETADEASFASTKSSSTTLILGVGAFAILIGLALAFLISRALVGAIRQMLAAADGIAGGDIEQSIDVHSKDELGEMAEAFKRMLAYLKGMTIAAERIADGDLSVELEPVSERDSLGNAFVKMSSSLCELIGQVGEAVVSMGSASREMASSSEETGRAVGEIAQAITDVATGAERQVSIVGRARISTEETGEAAEQASVIAQEGVAAAAQASGAMQALRESNSDVTAAIQALASKSEQIGGIVEAITRIASQTNLLALNAAIEAARAGEQGRGFAVVAEEVRKLAEESQEAAASIGGLIGEIQSETERTVGVVAESGRKTEESSVTVDAARESFERIGSSVDDMRDRIVQIVEATNEVSAVAEQSSAATEQVSASTEQTSASAEQVAASAQELSATADILGQLVGRFKLAA